MEQNTEFSLAYEVLEYTGNHVFLTGKAGTGKTTFLKHFNQTTLKNTVITAPTGVAAINAGGVTLHSMFFLPFQAYVPSLMSVDRRYALNTAEIQKHFRFNKRKLEMIRELDVLVIDEISMVRADMLDAVNLALQTARRNPLPFGGVQVLMIGDMFQLPPVVKQEEGNILQEFYQSPYFFDAKVMEKIDMISVELKTIYRQSDGNFISLLNDIRNNNLDEYHAHLLDERYQPHFENEEKIITLTTHNRQADEINQENLQAIEEKSYGFYAEIEGKFPENAYPMPVDMELKKGAKVMFIKNDSSADKRYYNGKIVEIIDINEDEIWVDLYGEDEPFLLEKEEWQNKTYGLDEDNTIREEVIGVFRHYPIRLAWAVTIHKSQGLTFDKVVIDAEKAFAPGQVYVALSRCTQLDGVYLSSRINTQNLYLDEAVMKFQDSFWNNEALSDIISTQKKPYAIQQLFEFFDFEKILKNIRKWIVYAHKNPNTYKEEISTYQVQIEKSLVELQGMQKKFKNIAIQQYQENPENEESWDAIVERSKKAVEYFLIEFTTKALLPLKKHIDEMESKPRTKTYLKEVFPLEDMMYQKVNQLKKTRILDTPLYSAVPKSDTEKNTQKKKRTKTPTHLITLQLYENGLNLEEIAQERELTVGTIEKHILKLIQQNKITSLDKFITPDTIQEITENLPENHTEMGIKEFYNYFKGKYSYFEIRLIKHLKEEENSIN